MPLPPAPSRRAALLAPEAFAITAPARAPQPPVSAPIAQEPARAPSAARARRKPQRPEPALAAAAAHAAPPPPTQVETRARASGTRQRQGANAASSAGPSVAPPIPSGARSKKPAAQGPAKLFVLDTNVLLHDPTSLFRFEEHDIFLPMIVLEELDSHKKGMTEVARNGRQASRTLDALAAAAQGADMAQGLRLDSTGQRAAGGHLFFQTAALDYSLPISFPPGKADNQILGVVQALRTLHAPREVVLVSKDINMRVKARALGLAAEDYQNDKTLEDGDLLYAGVLALPPDFWAKSGKNMESWQSGAQVYYRIGGPVVAQLMINQFVFFEAPGEPSLFARVSEIREKTAVLRTLKDYGSTRHAVWGVTTRNREQNYAMNLLMDPEIDFVTLTGTAGTGKTLLALAAGLTQVLDERRYTEIIMTRATVSVGEDIGFLPGTEEEKMGPWMGALDDNLEFLAKGDGGNAGEWGRAATNELIRSRIKIKSMSFMRGRTFLNKYVIIDEAQNLTPKQMKTLITRAGPGTKIICMGNLAQIDTPYLTEGSSGLTYAVDRFKGWPHGGHITLARGERSRLADFASEVL
ncbi:PhoH family protein [Verminephrobacter aporrectodeae subsp. tuberculatae]|uniref:PhoH family protein n=2 Tax=Verminephrobacter aporrectodeae TaxID=1110389 RepID=UPI0002375712|nr:PhoH family protein [Verminephrobacter aporrectodeae]MCW5223286.1 PhoH family protein [Verminephrobacter aporrectodeae subsp. tuberculatae]MCW5288750.1 PhoH family protein [Verminephrobacter aporrectodeae subsp. tuberculatae]